MIPAIRRQKMLDLLQDNKLLFLPDIIDAMNSSESTVRRDLKALAKTGEVELLRGQVASLTDRSIRMADKMDCLNAENAKLRELAVLNWEWAHSCCGNNCKMQTDGCGYQIDRECNYEREIYDRMRELGVEVDA